MSSDCLHILELFNIKLNNFQYFLRKLWNKGDLNIFGVSVAAARNILGESEYEFSLAHI